MLSLRILTAAFVACGLAPSVVAPIASESAPPYETERCSCARSPDMEAQAAAYLLAAEIVVEVLVIGVDTLGGPLPDRPPPSGLDVERDRPVFPVLERLQVERIWKGEVEETITRYRGDAWANLSTSCDITLHEGDRYLLFARKSEQHGWFWAGYCSGTTSLDRAEASGLRARVAALAGGVEAPIP